MIANSFHIQCHYCKTPYVYTELKAYSFSIREFQKTSRCPQCHTLFVLKYHDKPDIKFWEIDVKTNIRARIYPEGGYAIVDRDNILASGEQNLLHMSIEQIKKKVNQLIFFL
jgi:hypothetical protein